METESLPSLLVVDDDDIFRERLARSFRQRGYLVTAAASVDAAILHAQADSPEFAVVDLRLPESNGLELIRALRNIDATTKIVVLTGFGSIATALEAVRLGATHYLTKPATTEEIITSFHRDSESDSNATSPLVIDEVPSLARTEWEHIQRVLVHCSGNISQAARLLGIHRRSLQRKLSKYPVSR
jgi:two-component system, response regulator RegA